MFEGLFVDSACAETLTHAVNSGRLPHAVILEGGDEETRRLAAKELAKAIVCTGAQKPCGGCRGCKKADSGNHPDIHLLEKDEKSAFIKVDAVRALKEQAMLLPNDGDHSVFIVLEAQNMNVQAQNALLKILEEPAGHVHFILTAESKAALLETIRSRATGYLLRQSDGASTSEQAKQGAEAAAAVLKALCGNEFELLCACGVFQKDKALLQLALPAMELILRDALLCTTAASPLSQDAGLSQRLHNSFTQDQLLSMRELVGELMESTRSNANQNLTATALSALLYEIKEP